MVSPLESWSSASWSRLSPLLAVTFGYVGGSVMTYLVYPDFIALHGWGMTGHPRVTEIRRQADEQLQKTLTPEQWQQFQQMRDEMRGRGGRAFKTSAV